MSIRYTQPCPTCGRRIQVQASLMGHSLACPHCGADFVAGGGADAVAGQPMPSAAGNAAVVDPLMARVERALARANGEQPVA